MPTIPKQTEQETKTALLAEAESAGIHPCMAETVYRSMRAAWLRTKRGTRNPANINWDKFAEGFRAWMTCGTSLAQPPIGEIYILDAAVSYAIAQGWETTPNGSLRDIKELFAHIADYTQAEFGKTCIVDGVEVPLHVWGAAAHYDWWRVFRDACSYIDSR